MIRIENTVCRAGQKTLLEIDSLHIQTGERVAILGKNGAGKSTLLKLLTGFVSPQTGNVQVNGQPVFPNPGERKLRQVRSQTGQVFQGLHLVGRLTVLENVLIGGLAAMPSLRSWTRLFTPLETQTAMDALNTVGMSSFSSARADKLSGGERQKVAIARMLMQNPALILADEPTAALDPTAARDTCELLRRVSEGRTLISVLHNEALVPMLADRVIGLKAGRIVLDCPVNGHLEQRLSALYE